MKTITKKTKTPSKSGNLCKFLQFTKQREAQSHRLTPIPKTRLSFRKKKNYATSLNTLPTSNKPCLQSSSKKRQTSPSMVVLLAKKTWSKPYSLWNHSSHHFTITGSRTCSLSAISWSLQFTQKTLASLWFQKSNRLLSQTKQFFTIGQ